MFESTSMRIALVVGAVAAVTVGGVAAYGFSFGFDQPSKVAVAVPTSAPSSTPSIAASTTTSTTMPTTTTTHPDMVDPPAVALPPVGGGLYQGRRSPTVLAYEQRLASIHFDPGPVDGYFDLDTRYAVQAVQKLAGLPRTGTINAATALAIEHFKYPKPMVTNPGPSRVEIDLDRQVLVVWRNWNITLITTTSTGSGQHFCGGDGGCQYAVTPAGHFHFQRHVEGWRDGALGRIFSPWYFNGGIAVHGYPSVPPYAASHGCARIPMHIAANFSKFVFKDEPVYVVGTPAHGGISADPAGNAATSTTRPSASSTTTGTTPTTVPHTTTTVPHTTTTVPHPTTTVPHPTTTAPHPTTT